MTTNDVIKILKQLSPLEIIENCGLDDDAQVLVEALDEFIEEYVDEIKERLIECGLIEEEEED